MKKIGEHWFLHCTFHGIQTRALHTDERSMNNPNYVETDSIKKFDVFFQSKYMDLTVFALIIKKGGK